MIEALSDFWTFFLRVVETAPVGVWAALAGTLAAWGVTQRAKFLIPYELSHVRRRTLSQAIAFAVGFGIALLIWPSRGGAILALLVGLWSPLLWWLFTRWLSRRNPELRDKLSQDVRT